MTLLSQNPDDADNLPPGRAGLVASEAGPEGGGSLLPRGRARQEPQEEQTHPSQPEGHPCKGTKSILLIVYFDLNTLLLFSSFAPPCCPPWCQ